MSYVKCKDCSGRAMKNRSRCWQCTETHLESEASRRAERKAKGMCTRCGKRKGMLVNGIRTTLCKEHTMDARARKKKSRRAAKAA